MLTGKTLTEFKEWGFKRHIHEADYRGSNLLLSDGWYFWFNSLPYCFQEGVYMEYFRSKGWYDVDVKRTKGETRKTEFWGAAKLWGVPISVKTSHHKTYESASKALISEIMKKINDKLNHEA